MHTSHPVHGGALRLSFQSRLCQSYVHPRRWHGPFGPLWCIPVFPMAAPGCCACTMVRCSCLCPLPWLHPRGAGLAVLRAVPCTPAPVVCASVRLPEAGVAWLGGTPAFSVGWRFSGSPAVVAATSVL